MTPRSDTEKAANKTADKVQPGDYVWPNQLITGNDSTPANSEVVALMMLYIEETNPIKVNIFNLFKQNQSKARARKLAS